MNGLTSPPEFGLDLVPEIDFAVKDPTVIETEVISSYEAAFLELTGVAKVLAPGDPVRLFLLCVCQWLSHQRVIIDFTGKQNLLQYATGDYLDNLGALYGARGARLPASAALTTLRFTLLAPLAFDALVPAGTQCQAPTGVIFETLVDGLLPTGTLSVDVPAQAMIDGVLGNDFLPGQINSIINWNQAWSLQVENIDTSAGGADEETDDQYRYRLWLAIESFSTCGPEKAYEFWALSAHPSIAQCVVHSAPDIAGEVWLYPLLRDGQIPSPQVQALVLASCSAETRRPLTDYVSVFSPALFTYTLSMTYYVLQSNEVLLGSIQTAVNQAVADWILWQRSFVSRDLNCDELRKRCLEAGAKRVVIASPTPTFQVMAYNQLAVHDGAIAPVVTYGGLEAE
jgi:phage-related baseplate assembly protein